MIKKILFICIAIMFSTSAVFATVDIGNDKCKIKYKYDKKGNMVWDFNNETKIKKFKKLLKKKFENYKKYKNQKNK